MRHDLVRQVASPNNEDTVVWHALGGPLETLRNGVVGERRG